ncbi:MAG: HD domain-containing phosphohydrolase [Cellulosilyticaceae bacterium]
MEVGVMMVLVVLSIAALGVAAWQYHERQKLQRRLVILEAIEELGERFNSQLKLSQLVDHIVKTLKREIAADMGALFLVNDEGNKLELQVALGNNDAQIGENYSPLGDKIADWVAHHGESVNLRDAMTNEVIRNWYAQEVASSPYEYALLTLPIKDDHKVIGVLQFINSTPRRVFGEEDQSFVEEVIRRKVVMSLEKAQLYEKLRTTFVDSIRTVASVIDAKDKYTIGHCHRVADYAIRLGRYMGLEDEAIEDLEYAAILHDVGKIGISDMILNKATSLTQEEYELVKQHPVLGAEILSKITTLKEEVVWGAKYHHERYDGGGYGEGLSGKEIPLYARIIAIVDAYDAMVGDRVYHKGIAPEEAITRLLEGKGTQFDPALTNLFVQMIRATERSRTHTKRSC